MTEPSTPNQARVSSVGASLHVPDHDYRLVPGGLVAVDDAQGLAPLAATHGAVSFEVLDVDDTWVPAVLFEVDVAWSILDGPAGRHGVATHTRGDRTMALTGWESCIDIATWDRAPVITAPGALASRLDELGRRVWEGASFRLTPHPILPAAPRRDWAHAWTRGWGPLSLTVEVARSREELRRFLEQWSPMPYAPRAELEFQEPSGHERAPLLLIDEGTIQLCRSYLEPSDAIVAFDGGLLDRLIAGDLGPLRWTLTDEDYVHRIASGEDARSLAEYLG